jgi:hypothetical protein
MEEKLGAWMKDNNSTRWSVGCRIVCWRYNTQIHRSLGNVSPYQKTFGQLPRVGISNLKIDPALLDSLHTEIQLNSALNIPKESCIEDAKLMFKGPAIPTMDENAATDEVDDDDGKVSPEEKQSLIVETLKIVETFDSRDIVEDDKMEYLVRLRGLIQRNKPIEDMVSACESVRLDADFVQSFVHACRNNSQPGTPVAAPKTPNNCSPSTVGSSEATDRLGFIPDLVCRWIEIIEGLVKPPDATVRSSFDGKQAKKIAHENVVLRVSPRRKALHDRGFKAQLKQAKK